MSEPENHPLGPQPDTLRISRIHHDLGDEMHKFMNTPQFDINNTVSNTLQQLNTTVQQLSTTVQQLSTTMQQMNTKLDTVIHRINALETRQRAR